jgi:hypothetical protein
MKMVGMYHIALRTEADEDAFVSHLASDTFGSSGGVLQLTRVTSGFECQVLRRSAVAEGIRQYAWQVTAQLVSGGYDFDQNVARLQAEVEQFGVVIGVDTFTVITEQGSGSD